MLCLWGSASAGHDWTACRCVGVDAFQSVRVAGEAASRHACLGVWWLYIGVAVHWGVELWYMEGWLLYMRVLHCGAWGVPLWFFVVTGIFTVFLYCCWCAGVVFLQETLVRLADGLSQCSEDAAELASVASDIAERATACRYARVCMVRVCMRMHSKEALQYY